MDKRLARRLDKIEEKLKPEKSKTTRLTLPDGSFIEIPDSQSLFDVLALSMANVKNWAKLNESKQG